MVFQEIKTTDDLTFLQTHIWWTKQTIKFKTVGRKHKWFDV